MRDAVKVWSDHRFYLDTERAETFLEGDIGVCGVVVLLSFCVRYSGEKKYPTLRYCSDLQRYGVRCLCTVFGEKKSFAVLRQQQYHHRLNAVWTVYMAL